MIEIGLLLAGLFILVAAALVITNRRDRARTRERHQKLEAQARQQSDRLRSQRARQRIRVAENRAKTTDKATVFNLRDNDKTDYTPRHQARNVTHTRTPGTDLGVTTNPALLYGTTTGLSDPSPSSSTSTGCGSSSSSSSSSYDSGGSSSCDSGGSF